ncbi:MAG TPA: glycosyltransferase family 4 protein [Pyrinomonadaceae bacterium]|nr:glycosyltransferase family 4 protein [Pyrinomonadaceae bacterium]
MRILFLSQFFDPEPFFKALPFAKELAKRGHSVEVLTGFPNYPGGRVYPGYRIKLIAREQMDGISIIRVPLYPSHDRSTFKRVLNYASFAFAAGILGLFVVKRADVAYVYHPPPTVGFAAIMMRIFRGIRFVYDIQDLWPDSLEATGMIRSKRALTLVAGWCSVVYRFASAIVVLSHGFKERLISRGVPADKIHVIFNWSPDQPATKDLQTGSRTTPAAAFSGKFNIVFAGNMGPAQALDTVLEAAEQMRDKASNVQFVFIGDGISLDDLKKKALERQLNNVVFLPRVSPAEAGRILQQADALLVHLKDDPLFAITIPSKTQAYLSAGKPILIGIRGDAARLVESANAGFSFKPESPSSLVSAVERLTCLAPAEREALGMNGKMYYEKNLSRGAAVDQFEQLFARVRQSVLD